MIDFIWSLSYAGWILAKITNPSVTTDGLIAWLVINILLTICFVLVIISYFQELSKNRQTPSITVTPQANLSLGYMESGATAPPLYMDREKTAVPQSKPQVYR